MPVTQLDVFLFSLRQTLFGQEVINTFAFRVSTAPTNTDEVAYMSALFADNTGYFNLVDNLRDELRQQQSNEVTHNNWFVSRVTPNPTQTYLFPIITNPTGELLTTCETANVSMCIDRKGVEVGKRARGRIAVAGIPTANYAAGRFGVDALSEAAGLAFQLQGAKDLGGALGAIQMGFWSPQKEETLKDGTVKVLPQLFTFCRSAQARETVRVQRSRTIGRGS